MINIQIYNEENNNFSGFIASENSIIPNLVWHITDICELSCPYCFSPKTGEKFDIKNLTEYMQLFEKLGVQKIDISGGEPLKYPFLYDLVKELSNNFYITLTSSGLYSNENRLFLINNSEKFCRIIFSIDFPNQQDHDKIRGKKGLFSNVIEMIKHLSHAGYATIRVNTVVTRGLVKETKYIEQFTQIIKRISPKEWCLVQPHPANSKQNFSQHSICDDEFKEFYRSISRLVEPASGIRLIKRGIESYSKYWVLHPNGIIKQHTNTSMDTNAYSFDRENIGKIIKSIQKHGINLPHTTNERFPWQKE